jgi:hypothetical protein
VSGYSGHVFQALTKWPEERYRILRRFGESRSELRQSLVWPEIPLVPGRVFAEIRALVTGGLLNLCDFLREEKMVVPHLNPLRAARERRISAGTSSEESDPGVSADE